MISNPLGFISGYAPSLNLDFTTGVFPSVLSFSRASAGTYFDSAGILQTAALSVPRLDYDPVTLQAKGLLIEEQRTNLIPGSNEFVPSYNPNGAVVTANATNAPTGVIEATTISTTATSVFNFNKTGTGVASGTSVAFSFFIKLVSAPGNISFNVYFGNNTSTAGSLQTFSFNSGVLSSPGSATIQNVGNGWYRVRFVQVLTADGNALGFTFGSIPASVTIALFGRQAEVGSFPTSYIPTTTAAVTRSADVCSMSLGSWFNYSQGSIFCEFSSFSNSPTAYPGVYRFGSPLDRIGLFLAANTTSTTPYFVVKSSSTATNVSFSAGTVTYGTLIKSAGTYDGANATYRQNGGYVQTSAAIPPGIGTMTDLRIGIFDAYLNGYIRKLTYYRNRLPNSLLQSLTA